MALLAVASALAADQVQDSAHLVTDTPAACLLALQWLQQHMLYAYSSPRSHPQQLDSLHCAYPTACRRLSHISLCNGRLQKQSLYDEVTEEQISNIW